ncbi:MAG: class I SAM-dependent methyltransferase [Acidobacteria bacterium]|nr:class I SAM-dependent methyltransferase [Acidobacteriota bacterium]
MDPARLERLRRERRDADRQYNDALTALDRELAAAGDRLPAHRDETSRIATALLVFLQQITAFVETKEREQAAAAEARLDELAPLAEAVAALRTQLAVLRRAMPPAAPRGATPGVPAPDAAAAGVAAPGMSTPGAPGSGGPARDDAHRYVAFEDQFRGSDEVIAGRLRRYLPIFQDAADVLDLGCGRGEFLAALAEAGIRARGVDLNGSMVAAAAARGLVVEQGDALSHLDRLPDASIGGLIATQVVEHLEPAYLLRLLDTAARVLRPGSPIVLETINASCWLAFFSSYIRDITHVRPMHPDTLQYLLRASGFERVTIQYSAPVPDPVKMTLANLPAEIDAGSDAASRALQTLAHAVNANATILNNLMFTHLDFAAVGYRA